MKLQDGKLSIGLMDVLALIFFPITLLVLPARYFRRKYQECPREQDWFWVVSQLLYLGAIGVTGAFFSINTLTYHRDIVAVETVEHMETVGDVGPASEHVVIDMVFVTIEERPKLFNTDQIKTWHFCRASSIEWFLVEDDGTLVPCYNDPRAVEWWEINRTRYLEALWDAYNDKLDSETRETERKERHKELTEKVRLNSPW